jgi:hypothetical protein
VILAGAATGYQLALRVTTPRRIRALVGVVILAAVAAATIALAR